MIEQAMGLATWRLTRMPAAGDAAPIAAEKLADHRKAYLTYEGPVSGDRGEVRRVDAGACEILEQSADCWRVILHGQWVTGEYLLQSHFEDRGSLAHFGGYGDRVQGSGTSWILVRNNMED